MTMLGYDSTLPRKAKVFLAAHVEAVMTRAFPTPEHGFTMKDKEYDELVRGLADPDGSA